MSYKRYIAKVSVSMLTILALLGQSIIPAFANSHSECRQSYSLCAMELDLDKDDLTVDFKPYYDMGDFTGYAIFIKDGRFAPGDTAYRNGGYPIEPIYVSGDMHSYKFMDIKNGNYYLKMKLARMDGDTIRVSSKSSPEARKNVNYALRKPTLSLDGDRIKLRMLKKGDAYSGYAIFVSSDMDFSDLLGEPYYVEKPTRRSNFHEIYYPLEYAGKYYVRVAHASQVGGEFARYERTSRESAMIEVSASDSLPMYGQAAPQVSPADTDPAMDPATDTDPAMDPATDTDPAMDPAADTDPAMDPAADTDPAMDPAADTDPAMDPAPDTDPAMDPAADADPAMDPAADADMNADADMELDLDLDEDLVDGNAEVASAIKETAAMIKELNKEMRMLMKKPAFTYSEKLEYRNAKVAYKMLKKKYPKMSDASKKKAKVVLKKRAKVSNKYYKKSMMRAKKYSEMLLKKADLLMKLSELYTELDPANMEASAKYEKMAMKAKKDAYTILFRLKKLRAKELRDEAKELKAAGDETTAAELETAAVEYEDEVVTVSESEGVEYEDEVITPDSPFTDIGMSSAVGRAAIYLYEEGVIGGYKDGTFQSDKKVNRAEAAKFLYLAKYGEIDDLKNDGKFKDVLEGEWYVKYVIGCANEGIINGDPDRSFRPADSVNRAELTKIIAETFDLDAEYDDSYSDVSKEAWYYKYMGAAKKYNMYPELGDEFAGADMLTRGEVAQAIYNVMSAM